MGFRPTTPSEAGDKTLLAIGLWLIYIQTKMGVSNPCYRGWFG